MTTAVQPIQQDKKLTDAWLGIKSMLRRRWQMLVLVTGSVLALAIVLIMLLTPKYDATTLVRIDPSRNPLASVQTQNAANLGTEAIETEVSEISSIDTARTVADRAGLLNDPEFLRGIENVDQLSDDDRRNVVAMQVLRNLSVGRERLTYMISISFRSEDSLKSARIANAFGEAYIDRRVGSRVGSDTRQAEFFQRQLAELSKEAQAADAGLANYRSRAGIVEGGGSGTVIDQQIAPLATQLATAESDAAEARSALNAARTQMSRGGLDAVGAVRASPVIGDMRRQRADIIRTMAEVSARYGDKHPEFLRVRDQLSGIDAQITAEANRAVASLSAAADAANARVGSLRAAMNQLESRQASNTRAAVTAQSLERDAENKRKAYERMSELSLTATQSAQNSIAQAEIVTRAEPPLKPTWPNRKLLAGLSFAVALALGLATIVTMELLAGGLRSAQELEQEVGLPLLASIPRQKLKKGSGGKTESPAHGLIANPVSIFSESLRGLRASLVGVRNKSNGNVFAITSALPEEGKTTMALALARVMALNGDRVLLIDCDMRRARLAEAAEIGVSVGLKEVLQDSNLLESSLVADHVAGLTLLPVAEPHFSVDDPFDNAGLKTLIDRLRGAYTYVLLDLPPVLGVTETRTAAAAADAVYMVIKWGSTPSSAVNSAVQGLENDGTEIEGAVFTMVDPKADSASGLYYSGKYTAYYNAK